MFALVARFLADPSDEKARARVEAHARRHPMALCLLSAEEVAALKIHNVKLS